MKNKRPNISHLNRFYLTLAPAVAGLILLAATPRASAAVGDYESATSGNWSSPATWLTNNGVSWVPALAAPTSANGVITIVNPNVVTNDISVTADQVVVASGAGLLNQSNATLTIVSSGAGVDLDIFGAVTNAGIITNTGTINVENGGQYVHFTNGGFLPPITWSSNSTCQVSGITTATNIGGLGQVFWHFNYNNPTQSSTANRFDTLGLLTNIRGNFSVTCQVYASSTQALKAHALALSLSGETLNIGGDLTMSNCNLLLSGNTGSPGSNVVVNLGGNFYSSDSISSDKTYINTDWSVAVSHPRTNSWGVINFHTNTAVPVVMSCLTHVNGTSSTGGLKQDLTYLYTYLLPAGVTLISSNSLLATWAFTNGPGSTLTISSDGGIEYANDDGAIQSCSQFWENTADQTIFPVIKTNYFEPNATYAYVGFSGNGQVTGAGIPPIVANLIISNSSGVTLHTYSGAVENGDDNIFPYDPAILTAVTNMLSVLQGTFTLNSVNVNGTTETSSGLTNSPVVSGIQGFGTISGDISSPNGNTYAPEGGITVANSGLGLFPGAAGVVGTLTFADCPLIFNNSSSKATFDLSGTASSGNDEVLLTGSASTLAGNGAKIVINPLTTLDTNDYLLVDATGTGGIASSFNSTPAWVGSTPSYAASYSVITTNNQVLLHYSFVAVSNPTPAHITSVVKTGANLVISGNGGLAGGTYAVITSTNAAAALTTWTTNTTGIFAANGGFTNSLSISLSDSKRFFAIKSP